MLDFIRNTTNDYQQSWQELNPESILTAVSI